MLSEVQFIVVLAGQGVTLAALIGGMWRAARWTQRVDSDLAENRRDHRRYEDDIAQLHKRIDTGV